MQDLIQTPTSAAPVAIDENRLAQLRQKAALVAAVRPWKPEEGDTLEGQIVGSRKESGPFGEQPQMLVQTPEGGVFSVWLTRWLMEQLRAQQATAGSLVSLTFLGKEQSKTGKTFNRYSLVVA
jgi:hypothetical protein